MTSYKHALGELFGGCGLGVLLGLIIGLSATPTVSTILGILATFLAAFFGLKKQSGDETEKSSQALNLTLRMGAFGFACAAMILFGLILRTHNGLGNGISKQVALWRDAGFSPEQSRAIVLYKELGLHDTSIDKHENHSFEQTVLFEQKSPVSYCQYFNRRTYPDPIEQINAMKLVSGPLTEFGLELEKLPIAEQKHMLDALAKLSC